MKKGPTKGPTIAKAIDSGTSSIGAGELTFDIRMARFHGWSELEIVQCYQQLEGVYYQWKRLVDMRQNLDLIQCPTCGKLPDSVRCSSCRHPLGVR